MKSLTEIKNILAETEQVGIVRELPAMIQTLSDPNNTEPCMTIMLAGPAGSSKSFTAECIARALGAEFVRVQVGENVIRFEELVRTHCALTRCGMTVWFFDESQKQDRLVLARLLTYTEPAGGVPMGGGKEDDAWVWMPNKNLVILASNKGQRDQAWTGQGGRAVEIEMLPLTKEAKRRALLKYVRESGLPITPTATAWKVLTEYCGDYYRPVKMRIHRLSNIFRTAGETATAETLVRVCKESEFSKRGFTRDEMRGMRLLAANPRGLQLQALTAHFRQAKDTAQAVLATLKEYDFAAVAMTGPNKGLNVPTAKGIAFLMEVDGVTNTSKEAS